MTRRNFFTKLVACATAPFAVKAISWPITPLPPWLARKYWTDEMIVMKRIETSEALVRWKLTRATRKYYKI